MMNIVSDIIGSIVLSITILGSCGIGCSTFLLYTKIITLDELKEFLVKNKNNKSKYKYK